MLSLGCVSGNASPETVDKPLRGLAREAGEPGGRLAGAFVLVTQFLQLFLEFCNLDLHAASHGSEVFVGVVGYVGAGFQTIRGVRQRGHLGR